MSAPRQLALGLQQDALVQPLSTPAADPRHVQLREFIKTTYRQNGIKEQWDGRCARALAAWLKANPLLSVSETQDLILSRFASDEPRGLPPWRWLPELTKYYEGPLDRYGKVAKPDWRIGYEGVR